MAGLNWKIMSGGVIVGVAVTIITLAVFLLWAYHELRRVDDLTQDDTEIESP